MCSWVEVLGAVVLSGVAFGATKGGGFLREPFLRGEEKRVSGGEHKLEGLAVGIGGGKRNHRLYLIFTFLRGAHPVQNSRAGGGRTSAASACAAAAASRAASASARASASAAASARALACCSASAAATASFVPRRLLLTSKMKQPNKQTFSYSQTDHTEKTAGIQIVLGNGGGSQE